MEMNSVDQRNLRSFLSKLYGTQVERWPMNAEMFELTHRMLAESSGCSDVMDLVPRPMSPGSSAAKYVSGQARSMFLRELKNREQHYISCVRTAAWKLKILFLRAAM